MNTDASEMDIKQQALIEDAAQWRLIGLLFECPADGWHGMLRSLAAVVSNQELKGAAEAAQSEASEGLYHSMFGPGGLVPAREVSYHARMELGSLMSELAGYYDSFGYQPSIKEPPDHVAVEAGFIGYLRLKEAYAQACGNDERTEITAAAARRFIKDHLAAMAEPLAKKLEQSEIRYLTLSAQALVRLAGPSPVMPQSPSVDSEDFIA